MVFPHSTNRRQGRKPLIIMRKVLYTDGSEFELTGKQTFEQIYKLIGSECDCIDVVRMRDGVHVMLVDDNGLLKDLPINQKATAIYSDICRGRNMTPIVGNVVIVPDEDYE